jgi:uncharacterized protein
MSLDFVIAVAVLLGLLLFFFRQARRPPGPARWGRVPRWPRRIRVVLSAIVFLLAFIVFWAFLIEPNRLVVREETIELENWPKQLDGLRIAVLSDIHVGSSFIDEKKLRTIVERTNERQPELIVILGDYMTPKHVPPEVFGPILKNLSAPLGTYSVLGNHDWWYDGSKVRAGLEQNGIKVLDNQVVQIQARGTSLWLVGLADLWTRQQLIDQTLHKVPEGQPLIALTHNPDIFPSLPERVPLLLAGHTHGGQVRFPLIGTVVGSSRYGDRYVRGHVFENNHHLFVTTGIGTSIIPVRFGVTPEIVILTLKSK